MGGSYKVKLTQDEKVSGHRPSVDVMFTALAQCAAPNISAMILTGMGKDGAEGMVALHQKASLHLPKMNKVVWYLACHEKQ